MKYIEFLLERNLYDAKRIPLTEKNKEEGKAIADKLNIKYNGWWEDVNAYLFTDDKVTGSSFLANSYEEAKEKLENKRKTFAVGIKDIKRHAKKYALEPV